MRNRKRKMSMKKRTKKRISVGIRHDWDGDRVCERIHRKEGGENGRQNSDGKTNKGDVD